jgi:hypothetical protein
MLEKKKKLVDDPRHWRRRAEQARAAAAGEVEPQVRQRLQRMAKNYDGLAEQAEKRSPSQQNYGRRRSGSETG